MRKALLSMAAALCALAAGAQGIASVGAGIVILPSTYHSGDSTWSAKTWVYNTGQNYGGGETTNGNYNHVWGVPAPDAAGKQWYEPGFDESWKEDDCNWDKVDEETGDFVPINWEEHTAPFSSDAVFGGKKSYQWTTGDVMADIYIRRPFATDNLLSGDVYLACGHDDAPCEYYINGELVFSRTGEELNDPDNPDSGIRNGWDNSEVYKLTDAQKSLIKLSGQENLLAVHVHQNWGGAFADCGLYTKMEGGLEMGFVQPWMAKALFNPIGGREENVHGLHAWEKLYEAREGDVYTLHLDKTSPDKWGEQMHFKTPINLDGGHDYVFRCKITGTGDYEAVTVKLTQNENDEVSLAEDEFKIVAGDTTEVQLTPEAQDLENLKIAFDFGGGQADSTTVSICGMSLWDETDEKELFVGSHYYNYLWVSETASREAKDEEGNVIGTENYQKQIATPRVDGRVETLAWTQADFDDSMWDDVKMPVGNQGYMAEVQTIWPGGDNNNWWIRRDFDLEKVNDRLEYTLGVCHDDTYETYVNGHLLQKSEGWTNGKGAVQVHIPAAYLNAGRNVIATYIQQGFGGKFYDCGISVAEVNYEECFQALRDAIALADTTAPLTARMRADLGEIIAQAREYMATETNGAEVKEYARVLRGKVSTYMGDYSDKTRFVKETAALCRRENKGYITAALADTEENLDTCANSDQADKFLTKLRVARKRNAAERRTDKFRGAQPEAWGDYYLLNVGDKRFLGGAEAWGAHAGTEYVSNAMTLEDTKGDGTPLEKGYRINTYRNNGGSSQYLNYGGFCDTGADDAWELIPVEGKENVYLIARASVESEETVTGSDGQDSLVVRHSNTWPDGSRYLLGLRDGDNRFQELGFNQWNVVDTDMKTPSLETNQWMLITPDEMSELMASANAEKPVDASHLIGNPGFDQRLDVGNWFVSAPGGNSGVWGRGGDHPDFAYEGWNCDPFETWTTINDLPAGWYEVAVQGYYRYGSYENHMLNYNLNPDRTLPQNAILYACNAELREEATRVDSSRLCLISEGINMVPGYGRKDNFTVNYRDSAEPDVTKTFKGPGTHFMPDGCDQATEGYFQNGLYWNRMTVKVEEGQPLTIGVVKDTSLGADWVVLDNWRLVYYGNGENPDGIGSLTSASAGSAQGETRAYNLAGQRVSKAQRGVYIVNGRKVVVK